MPARRASRFVRHFVLTQEWTYENRRTPLMTCVASAETETFLWFIYEISTRVQAHNHQSRRTTLQSLTVLQQ